MSKELEALKEIDKVIPYVHLSDEYKTIETALKRLEELEAAFRVLLRENEKIEKELSKEIEKNRALEIIKNCCLLGSYPNETYELSFTNKIEITKEEYDLLKEILL